MDNLSVLLECGINDYIGEKSVDDVCAIIQDRVNTYISESK